MKRRLTGLQLDVLQLISFGWSNKRIGHKLGVSAQAVAEVSQRMQAALQAKDRANAVAIGFREGLLTASADYFAQVPDGRC